MPHDPLMVGALGLGAWPAKLVHITWDVAMDTGVTPAVGSFTITDQGVPGAPIAVGWINPVTLQLNYAGQMGGGAGTVTLDVMDSNLRSAADLAVAAAPQSQNFTT